MITRVDRYGISKRIKILRGELSQMQFAKKLGVSQAYISDLELGKKTPSVDFLLTLNKECDVSIDSILRGTNTEYACDPEIREVLKKTLKHIHSILKTINRTIKRI